MQRAPVRCHVTVVQASVHFRGPQRALVRSGPSVIVLPAHGGLRSTASSGPRRALVRSGLWSAAGSGSQRALVRDGLWFSAGSGPRRALVRSGLRSATPWVLRSPAASFYLQRFFILEGAAPQL